MNATAKRLQKLMTAQDLSYGELSKITGIPKSALHRYATGETEKVPIERAKQIAAALHTDTNYLLGFSPEAQIENIRAEIEELQQALQNEPEGDNREDMAETLAVKEEELEDLEFMYHIRAMTKPKSAPAASLTEDEARLIEWWRTLTEEKQKAILNLSKVF